MSARKDLLFLFTVFVLTLWISAAYAAQEASVAAIVNDPDGYVNKEVKIEGTLREYKFEPSGSGIPSPAGYYILQDGDSTIRVESDDVSSLVEIGRITVTGQVMPGNTVFLKELKRDNIDLVKYLAMLSGLLFVGLVVLLVYVLVSTRRAVRAAAPAAPATSPMPAPTQPAAPSAPQAQAPRSPVPERAAPTELYLEKEASLEVVQGMDKGRTFDIKQRELTIGREDSDFQLSETDVTVSRKHARLEYRDGNYVISNISKVNPMKVNDEEVDSTQLNDGDEIQVGSAKLRFHLEESQ